MLIFHIVAKSYALNGIEKNSSLERYILRPFMELPVYQKMRLIVIEYLILPAVIGV